MSNSNLIDIRMKLSGGKAVVSGLMGSRKETEKLGSATSKTSKISEKAKVTTGRLAGAYHDLSGAAKLGLGFLGAGGLFAIESSIHATEELSKTTSGLSRNLGFSTEMASRWGAVAASRELDTKSLNMAFGSLSTKMVEAGRKGGSLLTPFHQLGISQEEVSKGANNFQWGLLRVAKALGEEEGGAKRSTAAKALLGKGYQTLLPLFSQGSEGLQEQLHWADEFGVTLSGKTNKGLEDMIMAQRKNKVAMLGLKVSLTTALMPAIEAGDDQLQEFIGTLNDPNMSGEEKIEKITQQFEGLEGHLVNVLERAVPKLAEDGGKLGLAIAGAVWHGFWHSDDLGKLAIGGWLLYKMGGLSAISGLGARVGGKLATSLGWRFLATVAPYFAAEAGVEGLGSALSSQMGGLKTLFGSKGALLGTALGVGLVAAAAAYVVVHQQDILDALGVDTNHGKLTAPSSEMELRSLSEAGYTGGQIESPNVVSAIGPNGKRQYFTRHGSEWSASFTKGGKGEGAPVPGTGHTIVHGHHHGVIHHKKSPNALKIPRGAQGAIGGGDVVVPVFLDGQKVAESVVKHAKNRAAHK